MRVRAEPEVFRPRFEAKRFRCILSGEVVKLAENLIKFLEDGPYAAISRVLA